MCVGVCVLKTYQQDVCPCSPVLWRKVSPGVAEHVWASGGSCLWSASHPMPRQGDATARTHTHTHTHTQNSRISFEFHSFFTYDLWLQHYAISVIMRANYFLREIRKTLKTTVLWDESLDGGKDWTFICEHCARCSVVVTGFWSNNQ